MKQALASAELFLASAVIVAAASNLQPNFLFAGQLQSLVGLAEIVSL